MEIFTLVVIVSVKVTVVNAHTLYLSWLTLFTMKKLLNDTLSIAGQGILYKGVVDCFVKIFRTEGILAFYKGWTVAYFRIGPHTTLSLMFWDEFRKMYLSYQPATS